MNKSKQYSRSSILFPSQSRFKPIIFVIAAVFSLFVFSAALTVLDSKYRLAPLSMNEWTSKVSSETLLHFMGFENPYFTQALPEDSNIQPVSSLALQVVTNIKPGDIRSLLGGELPGFKIFDSEIIVAGEGTDYTNLPIESAPPLDVMMEERKVATKKLKELEEKEQNQSPSKPKKTTNAKKVVYIYSTHSTESFLPILKGTNEPSKAYSSKVNITNVAQRLGKNLREKGIGTEVNTTNFQKIVKEKGGSSYDVSGKAVKAALNKQSNLKLVFDIHRDSARKNTTKTIDGKKYARTWFVIGKGHPDYEQNEQMATKLDAMLEKRYPGISRGVLGKSKNGGKNNGVYNQDLSDHAMLIEFGGVNNTMKELYRTADALAEVIRDYYWQQQKAEKVNG